jgi:hypothetical protein
MVHPLPSPELKLRLAIREALSTLEAARTSAPSIVAAGRLTGIVRELRELSISLEPDPNSPSGQPVPSPVMAAARLNDILRDLHALLASMEPGSNSPPLR